MLPVQVPSRLGPEIKSFEDTFQLSPEKVNASWLSVSQGTVYVEPSLEDEPGISLYMASTSSGGPNTKLVPVSM
ncbi:hypothetical protein RRF57_005095 [Xylaria bambusicola]|uniref:Uncharacterized protein n=1 Tax=Xylaria bambusicola TaxID=326684 RepID=A0AAN7UBT0_9PEZI